VSARPLLAAKGHCDRLRKLIEVPAHLYLTFPDSGDSLRRSLLLIGDQAHDWRSCTRDYDLLACYSTIDQAGQMLLRLLNIRDVHNWIKSILLVMQRFHRINPRRASRWNVVRDQHYRKQQSSHSGHHLWVKRRNAVEQCA